MITLSARKATAVIAGILLFSITSAAKDIDPWTINADKIDPSDYYGVTVANGIIGVVSSPNPFEVKDVVLNGAYDLYGRGMVSNFLKSFNLLNMGLTIDTKEINSDNITDFKQSLDMKNAVFQASGNYQDKASFKYEYYALRQLPYSVLAIIEVTAKKDIKISGISKMQAPDSLRDVENYYTQIESPNGLIDLLTSSAKSPTGKLLMCASNSFIFTEEKENRPKVIHVMWDSNMHFIKFSKNLKAGQTYKYAIVGSSITSAQNSDPLNEAQRMTIYASLEGMSKLVHYHKNAWSELWKSNIEITGDSQAQQDVHSMLYHLYSFLREDSGYSLSPMGLSGLGYNGHIFWDADIWMFPALLMLHPELAKNMVEYRINRLEAARKNAFSHGYKGAMFPWESAVSGNEETPIWALSGPFEHHITADVALAAWNYYCVTHDKKWLREKGWAILSATADFWTSRVERNGKGQYDIKNVVAADEWAENIDNNAFTNAAAKANLYAATKAALILDLTPNPDWNHVADNIPILKMENGVTAEYAGYKGIGIKQADVNLLAYPLNEITDKDQIKKDLEFYQVRVPDEGTPAMTQAVFSLLYSRLGNRQKARHFFEDAYIPNLNPPFRVIAETKGGTNPYFATGAGGVLQAVIMGFGGLTITPDGIKQIDSVLPEGWKSLKITGVGPNKKTYIKRQ